MRTFIKKGLVLSLLPFLLGCSGQPSEQKDPFSPEVVTKNLSKAEYVNKTLGGLLGQFSGFLSGYEFVRRGPEPYVGMPEDWFEFINGPYAGNFKHFQPFDAYRYDRLVENSKTKMNEVWSDDDYHVDIFNQLILKEFGFSSQAIKEAWSKYIVGDWGGGADAMALISANGMLAPFTGSLEGGNRFGWCTEAYIENETLGMNAPGMPNLATKLVDKFGSNVGYFDSLIWGKFYGALYSLCYFEDDILVAMEKAKAVLPLGSRPQIMYEAAKEQYALYPNDYVTAAKEMADLRTPLYGLDNIQTDPNVNGAFAILSWLYGKNSYLDTCKYSSIMGYDGDCTAAICCGAMGILKGFKEGNEEYAELNDKIYYNGEGVYYNDEGLYAEDGKPAYVARIKGKDYPARQKIDDIVSLYQENFETLLAKEGGKIEGEDYIIPTSDPYADRSLLFTNYGGEERTIDGFVSKGASLECLVESDPGNTHSGYGCFVISNEKDGEAFHTFKNLEVSKYYRLNVTCKNPDGKMVSIFARDGNNVQEINFATAPKLVTKELIFLATSSSMDVGFSFGKDAQAGSTIVFDDFSLERIERKSLGNLSNQSLKLFGGKMLKTLKKPEGVNLREEVTLSLNYRCYSETPVVVSLTRNSLPFGSVVLSPTSAVSTTGVGVIDIPYVFEKESDAISLTFEGSRLYFGEINVFKAEQYMFR